VRLSHLCTLLKLFDRCGCVWAGSLHLWGRRTRCVRLGTHTARVRGAKPKHAVANCNCLMANRNEKWFLFLANYLVLFIVYTVNICCSVAGSTHILTPEGLMSDLRDLSNWALWSPFVSQRRSVAEILPLCYASIWDRIAVWQSRFTAADAQSVVSSS